MSVVAFFCEDIREEKRGIDTLIGLLPDNVHVSSVPVMMPKLHLYVRMNLPASDRPKEVRISMRLPNGEVGFTSEMEDSTLDKAYGDAERDGLPIAGIIVKVEATPFQILNYGLMTVEVEIDGKKDVVGLLNFKRPDDELKSDPS